MARKHWSQLSGDEEHDQWIQGAIRHPGEFTRKAKAAGMGVQAYARKVLAEGSRASTRTKRQAALARTLAKLRKK